jgi:hypothetical protein
MRRALRPLTVLGLVALISAGCGSNAPSDNGTASSSGSGGPGMRSSGSCAGAGSRESSASQASTAASASALCSPCTSSALLRSVSVSWRSASAWR